MTTKPALDALNDLVHTARTRAGELVTHDSDLATRMRQTATKLDAVRTRLVQDGDEYLDQAWAFVDGARMVIAVTTEAATIRRKARERAARGALAGGE